MALEVAIEKKAGDFRLEVEFVADAAPVGLLGPSGSGKTMTLRAIAGLDRPDSGRIVLDGRVLYDSRRRIDVPARERRIGLLFQQYALFPHLTVAENVAFGLWKFPEDERARRTGQQLAAMRLEPLANRHPNTLSGGEQQRVALARALATEPAALLLDEPFSALDTHLRSALERQLRDTLENYRGSTVFVSHNLEEAYRVCRDLVVLEKGTVAARGPKEEIFRHPPTLEVARLTGCKNFSRARRAANGKIEAIDWGCDLRVAQELAGIPEHVAIRAHHIRIHPSSGATSGAAQESRDNVFPCWLAAISETPFRVTLDLRIGGPPAGPADFHVHAEVFKQEWEAFRRTQQPWQAQLPPEWIFLLAD